jgi:hypothetical protein
MRKAVLSLARGNLVAGSPAEGTSFDHCRPSDVPGPASGAPGSARHTAGARSRRTAGPVGLARTALPSRPRRRRPPFSRRVELGRFARFLVVGSVGTLLDFGLLALLTGLRDAHDRGQHAVVHGRRLQ